MTPTAALEEVRRATLKEAGREPGEPSPAGLRRLKMRVPAVRTRLKQGYSFLDGTPTQILDSWHYIYNQTDLYEVAHQAIYYYQYRSLSRTEFNKVRQWINRCDCWEHSDGLSKVYAQVFEENSDWVMPWYVKWNADRNPWKRRQSVVGLLEYARKRKIVQPFEVLIGFVEPLLADEDYYVQKGVGWTLREIYNLYPAETLTFIEAHLGAIDPLAWPAATEKLNKKTKTPLVAARKRLREQH